jgi:hypothetical protein
MVFSTASTVKVLPLAACSISTPSFRNHLRNKHKLFITRGANIGEQRLDDALPVG